MTVGKKTILRYFQLKLSNAKDAKIFDLFQRKTIFSGRNLTDVIMAAIIDMDLKESIDFTPLSEPDMLKLMIKRGVGKARQSLKRMRERGELVDQVTGDSLWGTDGATIIYNSEAVIKLLKSKSKTKIRKISG